MKVNIVSRKLVDRSEGGYDLSLTAQAVDDAGNAAPPITRTVHGPGLAGGQTTVEAELAALKADCLTHAGQYFAQLEAVNSIPDEL